MQIEKTEDGIFRVCFVCADGRKTQVGTIQALANKPFFITLLRDNVALTVEDMEEITLFIRQNFD